jgi:hypothetical protein
MDHFRFRWVHPCLPGDCWEVRSELKAAVPGEISGAQQRRSEHNPRKRNCKYAKACHYGVPLRLGALCATSQQIRPNVILCRRPLGFRRMETVRVHVSTSPVVVAKREDCREPA